MRVDLGVISEDLRQRVLTAIASELERDEADRRRNSQEQDGAGSFGELGTRQVVRTAGEGLSANGSIASPGNVSSASQANRSDASLAASYGVIPANGGSPSPQNGGDASPDNGVRTSTGNVPPWEQDALLPGTPAQQGDTLHGEAADRDSGAAEDAAVAQEPGGTTGEAADAGDAVAGPDGAAPVPGVPLPRRAPGANGAPPPPSELRRDYLPPSMLGRRLDPEAHTEPLPRISATGPRPSFGRQAATGSDQSASPVFTPAAAPPARTPAGSPAEPGPSASGPSTAAPPGTPSEPASPGAPSEQAPPGTPSAEAPTGTVPPESVPPGSALSSSALAAAPTMPVGSAALAAAAAPTMPVGSAALAAAAAPTMPVGSADLAAASVFTPAAKPAPAKPVPAKAAPAKPVPAEPAPAKAAPAAPDRAARSGYGGAVDPGGRRPGNGRGAGAALPLPAALPTAKRPRRSGRPYRIAGVILAVVALVAAGVIALVLSGRSTSGPGVGQGSPARGAGAAVRKRAAGWVAGQVSPTAVVACDPVMCQVLRLHGVPAGRLYQLGPQTTSPLRSQIIVATPAVRAQFGNVLSSVYAPAVLASFGFGPDRIDIRVTAQHGAAAYRSMFNADLADRKASGAQLLQSGRIAAGAIARRELAEGDVDGRLLLAIAQMAATHPMFIVDFGAPAPGAALGMPLRQADLAEDAHARRPAGHVVSAGYVRSMLLFLHAQHGAFRPARVQTVHLADGATVLRIQFTAPSPLGLLGPRA